MGECFRELKLGCQCQPQCKTFITTREEDEENENEDEEHIMPHCFRCLRIILDKENDNDYFLCTQCEKKAPTCKCGAWAVEPTQDRTWGDKCIECINI
jgi:hypothetical protein